MGFASLVGYSTDLPVLVLEAAIVGGALAGGVVLARWCALAPTLGSRWARRSPTGRRSGPTPA